MPLHELRFIFLTPINYRAHQKIPRIILPVLNACIRIYHPSRLLHYFRSSLLVYRPLIDCLQEFIFIKKIPASRSLVFYKIKNWPWGSCSILPHVQIRLLFFLSPLLAPLIVSLQSYDQHFCFGAFPFLAHSLIGRRFQLLQAKSVGFEFY
ncbi:hypothetical protein D3C85_1023860 [compost metagenome]